MLNFLIGGLGKKVGAFLMVKVRILHSFPSREEC